MKKSDVLITLLFKIKKENKVLFCVGMTPYYYLTNNDWSEIKYATPDHFVGKEKVVSFLMNQIEDWFSESGNIVINNVRYNKKELFGKINRIRDKQY